MDVIIPLSKGSQNGNMELRYCLRSIEKWVKDVQNVFIIGEKPLFLKDVIHVRLYDISSREQISANIFRKTLAACQDKRVSDDFYFFSDDHFLLEPFIPEFYHCGPLSQCIEQMKYKEGYFKTMMNTYVVLKGGTNFNVHCPIVYNKERFLNSVATKAWNIPYGYAMKSLYCNLNGLQGKYIEDLKIKMNLTTDQIRLLIKKRPFFSIGDTALNDSMKAVLEELYPQKSSYES